MKEIIKIKKSEIDFDYTKITNVERVDLTTEGIEITFNIQE